MPDSPACSDSPNSDEAESSSSTGAEGGDRLEIEIPCKFDSVMGYMTQDLARQGECEAEATGLRPSDDMTFASCLSRDTFQNAAN